MGVYELRTAAHSATLILSADGGGTEVATNKKGQKIELAETWKVEGRSLIRTPCVHFEVDGEGTGDGERRSDGCSQAINWTPWGATIEVAADFGLVYDMR